MNHRSQSLGIRVVRSEGIMRSLRFLLDLLRDLEPGGASVLASLRVVSIGLARPQPRPATNGRLMESGLILSDLLDGHEPKVPRTWPSAPRFMEKSVCLLVVAVLLAGGTLAQGQFMFANRNPITNPPIDARLFGPDSVPLEGMAYLAQAYVKLAVDPDSSYAPVGSAVNFRTGIHAGYIAPVVVTTPYIGGTPVNVEMRVWETSGGPTYEAAVAAGRFYGFCPPVTLTVTEAPLVPADMIGLEAFILIPEPASIALLAFGAAAVLRRRRVGCKR